MFHDSNARAEACLLLWCWFPKLSYLLHFVFRDFELECAAHSAGTIGRLEGMPYHIGTFSGDFIDRFDLALSDREKKKEKKKKEKKSSCF